jgi:hypothetical protein
MKTVEATAPAREPGTCRGWQRVRIRASAAVGPVADRCGDRPRTMTGEPCRAVGWDPRPEWPPSSPACLGTADWERRMRGGIRRSRGRAPTSARVGWRRPEVVEHEAGHVAAELLAGHEVDHGVLTGEDPAEGGFVGGGLEAAEGPGYPGI